MVHRGAFCSTAHPTKEKDEKGTQTEDCKAGHAEAHHHAAREGDFQALAQARASRLGGAHVGLGGDAHAYVACKCREHGTDDKRDNDEPVGGFHHGGHKAKEGSCHDDEHREDAVLSAQKSEGAFVNVLRDFAHTSFADTLLAHPCGLDGHDNEAENGQTWNEVEQ